MTKKEKKETKIIAFANQKGGCAKTTSAINTAYAFAKVKDYKVLLIDFDSQGSASLNLGIDIADENTNTIDKLLGAYVNGEIDDFSWDLVKQFIYTPTFESVVRNGTKWDRAQVPYGFDVIPANLPLSLVELQMGIKASETGGVIFPGYLKKITDVICENADYDVILIDTPPSLGSLSINAIFAATSGCIIPSNLDIMSFRGIASFKESAEYVQSLYTKAGLKHRGILGILLSLYSNRRSVDRAIESYIVEFYPTPTFKTQIRESTDAKRANASNMLFCQINKKAMADFTNLVDEIEFAIDNQEEFEIETKKRFTETSEELKEEAGEGSEDGE